MLQAGYAQGGERVLGVGFHLRGLQISLKKPFFLPPARVSIFRDFDCLGVQFGQNYVYFRRDLDSWLI